MTRDEILGGLRATIAAPDSFLVGAAIGTGMMARAAERGGADFLLALNAGRLRVMGAPSLASMLPLRDSNAFVADFARTEILTQSSLPVFFGASTMDPDLRLDQLVADIGDWGFAGLTNFPTTIHYPGHIQARLERAGLGFGRELELLDRAKAAGLCTLAYVRSRDQARRAAELGVDLICINVGWNQGGERGALTHMTVDQVAVFARTIVQDVTAIDPRAICLLEGGPIVDAEHLAQVCRETRIHGYVGGSTLDRLPLEDSVSDRTQSFKLAQILGQRMDRNEDRLRRFAREAGMVGGSAPMLEVYRAIQRHAESDLPVLIAGEPGSGRSLAAEAIHRLGARGSEDLAILSCADTSELESAAQLFGKTDGLATRRRSLLADQSGSTLFLEQIDLWPRRLQARLARFFDRGHFTAVGGRKMVRSRVRLICSCDRPIGPSNQLHPDLARHFAGAEIFLPPLRDRMEDLAETLEQFLTQACGPPALRGFTLAPPALHALLKYDWPGNLNEVRSVAQRLANGGYEGRVGVAAVEKLLAAPSRVPRPGAEDERDLILSALRRHRFRRGETATFLRISRKTLYNKIRRYGLQG